MKAFFLLILTFSISFSALAGNRTDSLLTVLKAEINKAGDYLNNKELRIKKLKARENQLTRRSYQEQFAIADRIYEEYRSYQFDSAYVYVNKMIRLSQLMNDKPKENYSTVKLAFILLSSGMFTETFNNLEKVDTGTLSDSVKAMYYFYKGRCYYDLANYNNDKYLSPQYIHLGNKLIDTAILFNHDYISRTYMTGLQKLQELDYDEGTRQFKKLLQKAVPISLHLRAMASCSLGIIYVANKQPENGLNLMIEATIADIRASTRETAAIYMLAELLYKRGDSKDAYQFIQFAKADADFYGARQRKLHIAAILPLIAAEELNNSENQKNKFLAFLLVITALALLVVFFLGMMFKQLNRVKAKEKIIEDKNLELEIINDKLIEDARIKEEYIGQFFKEISGYILKLEKLQMSIDTKLSIKKYEDIHSIIKNINIKKERESLYYSFDHIFIKIFPNFIPSFNALFEEKDQTWPHEEEVLNTDLRIYALIRIGINDNETIARILEYSVNTIYVYKMRIRARSKNPDDFETKVMSI